MKKLIDGNLFSYIGLGYKTGYISGVKQDFNSIGIGL